MRGASVLRSIPKANNKHKVSYSGRGIVVTGLATTILFPQIATRFVATPGILGEKRTGGRFG
jgi:hypothetical protein